MSITHSPKRRLNMLRVGIIAVFAVTILVTACGDDSDPAAPSSGAFVGKVEDSNAYIGLVVEGEKLVGYVCDGTNQVWIGDSAIADGKASLVSRQGQSLGTVEFDGDDASGKVDFAGQSHEFDASVATGEAGLYWAKAGQSGTSPEIGWVVLPDGSQRGGFGDIGINTKTLSVTNLRLGTITAVRIISPRDITTLSG